MTTANNEFWAARERIASLTNPDACLSRQELAELANTWIWDHHKNKDSKLTASYIGKLEQGLIRWPGTLYREAFRAVFGAPTDSTLGFVNARRKVVKRDNVKRRQFNHAALGVGALTLGEPLAVLLGDGEPTPIPARVGATDIEQIRTATREFTSWTRTYGGGMVREAAVGQLRWSAGLLEATCPARLRPELFSAVGDLAAATGYLAEEVNAQAEARRVYGFAMACAERAEDWSLRADILSGMAEQSIRAGQPDEGLTLAEQGLVRPDRLTVAGRTRLHTDRGRALAKMHLVNEALTAIGTADEHSTSRTSPRTTSRHAWPTTALRSMTISPGCP